MAFLVCFSWSPPDDHAQHRAIYLDQTFYESIWRECRVDDDPYTVLREIALLQYKSPTLVVAADRLPQLERELVRLEKSGVSHPQIADFRAVCAKAIADGCVITVSGDMYPELWRQDA